jgi:rhodanese-related sulfurtransferase
MNLALWTLQLAGRESLAARHAENMVASGGQLIDIRSPDDFRRGALPGARNLPLDALSWDYRYLDKSAAVILCGTRDVACARAARLLAGKGFKRIYHLADVRD